MVNVLIAGGRDYVDTESVSDNLMSLCQTHGLSSRDVQIVHGGAKGADTCAHELAKKYGFKELIMTPDWDTLGKKAGMIRNGHMVDIADYALIFWDGISKGTENSLSRVIKKGIPFELIRYDEDILTFTHQHTRWLSNMSRVKIEHKGIIYPSTENFYQAMKYDEFQMHNHPSKLTVRSHIASLSPVEAKKFSKENIMTNVKFEENKLLIMEWANYHKFQNPNFKSRLLSTSNALLEEGNWWGDKFWGVDIKTREGENHLGKIIMKVRSKLRGG